MGFPPQRESAAAWGAIELATALSFFEGIRESNRASVLSAFNLANSVAIAIGALVGARLFTWLDGSAGGDAWLFAISSEEPVVSLESTIRLAAIAPESRPGEGRPGRCYQEGDPRARKHDQTAKG